jgi:hypothetical protein
LNKPTNMDKVKSKTVSTVRGLVILIFCTLWVKTSQSFEI